MKKKVLITALAAVLILVCTLVYTGVIQINGIAALKYEIRGVDVSAYQGEIDWEVLSKENIDFAFIKATEGSTHVDEYFEKNFENAKKTALKIGAYHFFSFESAGETQAQNFIKNVGEEMPLPVIDVEYYGKFNKKNSDVPAIKKELRVMVEMLKDYYGQTPIIYATKASKNEILGDDFDDCFLWLRSVYFPVNNKNGWTFWQYSNRGRLKGYSGREKYIDLNVFRGTRTEFERMFVFAC